MVGQTGRSLIFISIGALIGSVASGVWALFLALLLVVALVLPLWVRLPRVQLWFGYVLCLALGACWVDSHWQAAQDNGLSEQVPPFEVALQGQVNDVRQTGSTIGFDLAVTQTSGPLPESVADLAGHTLSVKCYRCPLDLKNHERWQLALKLRPFVSFQNPGGMSYRQWMLAQGYSASAYVLTRKDSQHSRLSDAATSGLRPLESLRTQIQSWIDQAQGSAFLSALLLGEKHAMSADQKRLLMGSGLGHLFVISGLHVGLVAMMFYGLASVLLRPLLLLGLAQLRPLALLVSLLGAGGYAVLSGLQVPAVRAWLMLGLAILVLLSHRRLSPIRLLTLALLAVLVLQPLAFKSMGAWLSFGIVAALILGFWGRGAATVTAARSGVAMSLWQRFKPMAYGLGVGQYYAFCAGALVLTAYAVPVSLAGIALNLVMIPLFTVLVLPLAMAGIAWASVTSDISVLNLAGELLTWIFQTLLANQHSVMLSLHTHDQNQAMLMCGLALMLFPVGMGVRLLGLVLLVVAGLLPHSSPAKGSAQITVLDVGQGSAALVRTQHHAMLVDTGRSFASGMTLVDFVVMPFIRSRGIQRLDKVLISHDDQDHSGGLAVLKRWGPEHGEVITQHACSEVNWQWDGVMFEQFQTAGYTTGNNGSCLLRVSAGGHSVLFSGDIEQKAEAALLQQRSDLRADVLVVPHHGSRTSSSMAWLQNLIPMWALVSAGRFNGYGHPHTDVVERYQALGVTLLGTYSHGAIEVELGAGQTGLKVSTYAP